MKTIDRFTEQAASEGVHLVVFPEMCITGYWHVRNLSKTDIGSLAEPVPGGPAAAHLLELSRQYEVIVGAGLIEVDEHSRFFNTYVIALPDGSLHKHRKLHCFISEHMESGDTYTVFTTPGGTNIGVLICYDNNIIENVRMTALMGCDVLLAPHQTGGCNSASPRGMRPVDPLKWHNRHRDPGAIEAEFRGPKGREWLMRWLPARAHDNGLFIVFSNGVGVDDDEIRTGNAMVLDPYGRILAETWKAGDDMVAADLDPAELHMCTGRRWMRSRRPDLYGMISTPTGREQDTRTVRFEKS